MAETGRAIASSLLDEGLIACAIRFDRIGSVYVWRGRVESAQESAALFKTTAAQVERAVSRLGALHPYETPAIVATVCDAAHSGTLEWLAEQTG